MTDSDDQWKKLGESNPFWGVLTDPRFDKDNLNAQAMSDFYRSGEVDVERFHATLIRVYGAPSRFKEVLDFGCGVGRLLYGFAGRADKLVGVDISTAMLKHAQTALERKHHLNFHLCTNLSERGVRTLDFDWVNSYIVLQHIPPTRGYILIESLLSLVRKGGFLSLHINAFEDETILKLNWKGRVHAWFKRYVLRAKVPQPLMTMYHYDVTQLSRLLVDHGFSSFMFDHENHGGQHGFIIYGRKNTI